MKISVERVTGWEEIYDGIDEVVITNPYTGIMIEVDAGTYGVCARDAGIEITRPDGSIIHAEEIRGEV
jgi:hypothetical protein